MTTHFSILAWRIAQTEEPDGLQSMGSQRVRHDLATEHTHTLKTQCLFCSLRIQSSLYENKPGSDYWMKDSLELQ